MPTLTYREAAKLVGRTPRAIRYWRQRGMAMGWEIRGGQSVRVVELEVLQAWFRQRLANDPAHQYRMRALRVAQEAAHGATRRVSAPPPPGVVSAPSFRVSKVSDTDTNH